MVCSWVENRTFHSYRLVDAFVPSLSRNEQSSHPLCTQTSLLRGDRKWYNLHRDARELPCSKSCNRPRRNIREPLQEERAQKSRGLDILQHTHCRKIPAFKASWSLVTKHKAVSRSQQLPLQALKHAQQPQDTNNTSLASHSPPSLTFSSSSAPPLSAGALSGASWDGHSWQNALKYIQAQDSFLHIGKAKRQNPKCFNS